MNFAIIGASGNVGRKTIEILEKSKIPFKELYLVASEKSAGKKIKFRGEEIVIENLESYDFSKAQITFFAAGSQIAKEWAPKAAKKRPKSPSTFYDCNTHTTNSFNHLPWRHGFISH